MKIPENVMNLLSKPDSTKIISSLSKDGTLHSIVAGSIMAMGEDRLFAAEIFMNTTSKNIEANKEVAILLVQDKESYLINATAIERKTEGIFFETMTKSMRENGIPVKGVWTFVVDRIFDQSAKANAGTEIF